MHSLVVPLFLQADLMHPPSPISGLDLRSSVSVPPSALHSMVPILPF